MSKALAIRRLDGLRDSLLVLFGQWPDASSRRRSVIQRRLLLGLELRWKIEEQVLLPAIQEAEPKAAKALKSASREIELLRDLALLAGQTVAANRQIVMKLLDGVTRLHFERVDDLARDSAAAATDWSRLDAEIAGLLERWQAELREHGEIEDEDRDPVGLPPR